jgi:hypothetical protein
MIQRVQSIYLLLTSVLSAWFVSGKMIMFSGEDGSKIFVALKNTGIISNKDGLIQSSTIILGLLFLIAGLLSLIAIFLYSRRKLQLILTRIVFLLIAAGIMTGIYYSIAISREYGFGLEVGYNLFLPPVMLLSVYLARKGIKKDDELIKSYDRLR